MPMRASHVGAGRPRTETHQPEAIRCSELSTPKNSRIGSAMTRLGRRTHAMFERTQTHDQGIHEEQPKITQIIASRVDPSMHHGAQRAASGPELRNSCCGRIHRERRVAQYPTLAAIFSRAKLCRTDHRIGTVHEPRELAG